MEKEIKLKVCMHPTSVPANDNQFIRLLVDSLVIQGVEVVNFSWKTALFAKYDVMHIHWPEYLTSSSRNIFSIIKGLFAVLLIIRLRIRNIPLVWTVHNVKPHETSRSYNLIHRFLLDTHSYKVYMQKSFPPGLRNFYVPHGNYAELFHKQKKIDRQEVSVLAISFGYVRPYKNIENLIRYFPKNLGALVIAGQPITADYGNHLNDFLAQNHAGPEVRLELMQLSEKEMLKLILSAQIAVLPYREIYNSGAVLMALSAPIPVIVTDSPSMRDLQAEVGYQWLQIIPSEFNSLDLQNALNALCDSNLSRRQTSPLSDIRNWDFIAKKYLQIYKDAIV
jgi:beta-1,4-mannosyltransferase